MFWGYLLEVQCCNMSTFEMVAVIVGPPANPPHESWAMALNLPIVWPPNPAGAKAFKSKGQNSVHRGSTQQLPSCTSTSDIIQHSILIYFSWKSKDLPFCTFVCPLKLFSRAAIDAFASFNTNALLHTMICCLVCNSLGLVSITLLRRSSKKRLREAFNDTRVVFTCIEGATTNSKSIPECEPFRSWRSAI